MTKIPDGKLLTTVELATLLDVEIRKLNQRAHRGLAGLTPLDVLRAYPIEAERIEERLVALALLRRNKTAVVQPDGVEFNKVMYQGEGTFNHIGEEVICGHLETRPDFIHIFDPNHGSEAEWLGKLTPAAEANKNLAGLVHDARRYQIETVQRADRAADAIRQEVLPQLRGGVVGEVGADPIEDKPKPRGKAEDVRLSRRLERNAESDIWKAKDDST